jgi:hypothetical protein
MSLSFTDQSCQSVDELNFNLQGSKEIGYETLKFSEVYSISEGEIIIEGLEWDNYSLEVQDGYEIAGLGESYPIEVSSGEDKSVNVLLVESSEQNIIMQIRDSLTGDLIDNAKIVMFREDEVVFERSGYRKLFDAPNLISGTTTFVSDVIEVSEDIDLELIDWLYNGTSTTNSSQIRFQLAFADTNDASTTWEFIGPDGSGDSYYENQGQNINDITSGKSFMKYKVLYDEGADFDIDLLNSVIFFYKNSCSAPGQIYNDSLSGGLYSLSIEKDGYNTYIQEALNISESGIRLNVDLLQN